MIEGGFGLFLNVMVWATDGGRARSTSTYWRSRPPPPVLVESKDKERAADIDATHSTTAETQDGDTPATPLNNCHGASEMSQSLFISRGVRLINNLADHFSHHA